MTTSNPQDHDSQMHSSPSTSTSSLFPAATDSALLPPTSSLQANSELSPPASQEMDLAPNGTVAMEDMMEISRTQEGAATEGVADDRRAPLTQEVEKSGPGYEWRNKKASEEYVRAMDLVVDQGFSLQEFGDPFDLRAASKS